MEENEMNSRMTVSSGTTSQYGKLWATDYAPVLSGTFGTFTENVTIGVRVNIKDVNILVKDKVVEVTFADGTKQKAVCDEHDKFDLETAISICISKKLFGGSGNYNKAVKAGMKIYNDKLKKIEEDKKLQELIEKKRAKRRARKQKRAEAIAAQKREEAIAIQTEAYIRAMKAMKEEGAEK